MPTEICKLIYDILEMKFCRIYDRCFLKFYLLKFAAVIFKAVWSLLRELYLIVGATRSHIDYLKKVREARIDRFVVETNKLLIRLDKLISADAPEEPSKRKGEIFVNNF